jgi:2-oxoglutarate dehydrogenase E1 component
MGAWSFVAPRLRELTGRDIGYIGRPPRASPAEGYADAHDKEQRRIVQEAVQLPEPARRRRGKATTG